MIDIEIVEAELKELQAAEMPLSKLVSNISKQLCIRKELDIDPEDIKTTVKTIDIVMNQLEEVYMSSELELRLMKEEFENGLVNSANIHDKLRSINTLYRNLHDIQL